MTELPIAVLLECLGVPSAKFWEICESSCHALALKPQDCLVETGVAGLGERGDHYGGRREQAWK